MENRRVINDNNQAVKIINDQLLKVKRALQECFGEGTLVVKIEKNLVTEKKDTAVVLAPNAEKDKTTNAKVIEAKIAIFNQIWSALSKEDSFNDLKPLDEFFNSILKQSMVLK